MDVTYASPVSVNGFSCRNCTEVDLAHKYVDPSHPKSGPFNRDAGQDPSRAPADPEKIDAVRKAAANKPVTGYGPTGYQTAPIAPGTAFSLRA